LEWFSFAYRKVLGFAPATLHDWLKTLAPLLSQSEVKPQPIMIHSLVTISRALRQHPVTTSGFDWFTVLSLYFVIGVSNYSGFG